MTKIVLTTLNSRFSHTSIALRYLYANLKELQDETKILEFTINGDIENIAEEILDQNPKIVGIGVYIWNALQVENLIEIIKSVSNEIYIVLGGPEVSHQPFRVNFSKADFIICGEGEISFYQLCKEILKNSPPKDKIIRGQIPSLKELQLPYKYYSDFDIKNRIVYVEASRGCPFECEFCLSSIDERVRYFDIDKLIEEFEKLWNRGVRNFKFIDRTFNLNMKIANRLIDFFLSKREKYSLHFEVIPENFNDKLKDKIKKFPPSSLQLEIGIQTLNKDVAKNINRKLNIKKIEENISFLENETNAHLHLDLIVGLPGENLNSFAKNLNKLVSLTKAEIQIGILKKLSGTTINRHDEKYKMIYSNKPPYDILQNMFIPFKEMQKMKRFARFWDLYYNSGNFINSITLLWKDDKDVFKNFYDFSIWIYENTKSTHQISLNRLSKLLFEYLTIVKKLNPYETANILIKDILKIEGREIPSFLNSFKNIKFSDQKKLKKEKKRQILRMK